MLPGRVRIEPQPAAQGGRVGRSERRRVAALCSVLLAATCCFSSPVFAADPSIRARGIELAKVARSRAKAKSFKLAAQMFHEAYNIDRAEWRYLFSAARCEQLAGMLGPAEKTYARFLKVSPTDHALRPRAARELTAVRIALAAQAAKAQRTAAQQGAAQRSAARAAAKAAKAAAGEGTPGTRGKAGTPAAGAKGKAGAPGSGPAAEGVRAGASAGSWRAPTGWTALALGVVATGVGGALYGMAVADKSALEQRVNDGTNSDGKVSTLTFSAAQAQREDIEGRLLSWGAIAGVGLGVAAMGAVLIATAPDTTQPVAVLAIDGSWQVGWMVRF